MNTKQELLPVLKIPPKVELTASGPISHNCRLNVTNDWEAICDWLKEHDSRAGTYRIYKREATRLFLWCRHKKGITLGQLSKDELNAYLKFLKHPDKAWCANRKAMRLGDWKPFVGPLGDAAYRTAVQVINSLLQYLTDANYLSFNPMKLIHKNKTLITETERQKYKVWERILEDDEWQVVQQVLQELPSNTKDAINTKERTKFLFALLYFLGLRISEVANSTWGAFRMIRDEWWFFVEGKGGKFGHIPVNPQLLTYIKHYRVHLGKSLLPQLEEPEHLLLSVHNKRPLGVRQLREIVKNIGKLGALKFQEPTKQQKLNKFSPHWLRHLFASHLDQAGATPTTIQANLRHSSLSTSQIYIHADDAKRFLETQKLSMDILPTKAEKEARSVLQLTIKTRSINTEYKFTKLIAAIEQQVLQGYNWQRVGDIDVTPFNYESFNRWSKSIKVYYRFAEQINIDLLEKFKQGVLEEADLRQFQCEVRV